MKNSEGKEGNVSRKRQQLGCFTYKEGSKLVLYLELRKWPQGHQESKQSRQSCASGKRKKKLSAADFIWAACRYGGDLDLGGSPQMLNARGITLAAPKQPLRHAIQSS